MARMGRGGDDAPTLPKGRLVGLRLLYDQLAPAVERG